MYFKNKFPMQYLQSNNRSSHVMLGYVLMFETCLVTKQIVLHTNKQMQLKTGQNPSSMNLEIRQITHSKLLS